MDRLGLEWLSVVGLPPPDLVSMAANAGCRHISTLLHRIDYNPFGYPAWSLRDDAALRRDMKARMNDLDVSISLGEGCVIRPGLDVSEFRRDLDVFAELGAARVNTTSFDPDRGRTLDQLGKLADMTREIGFELTLEFAPILTIRSLGDALDLIAAVGQPHLKILIDTMHFVRAGHDAADLRRCDPAVFGYIQISDGPCHGEADYMDEAMNNRMIPGQGEMPLQTIIDALPDSLIVAMEIPLNAMAATGITAQERVDRAAVATRSLLAACERAGS